MAAHLFGYVGEITEAQLQRDDFEGVESGTIVGQAGIEQAYNRLLMGTDGNKTVVVNSVGREIRDIPEAKQEPKEGRRLQLTIDSDVQKAIEDGFTASELQRRRGGPGSAERRSPRVHQPAGLRSERVRGGHRPRDLGRAEHRRAQAAAEPRAPGTLLAWLHVQDGRRPGRARRGHHHARLQGPLRRRRDLLRALLPVLARRADTASSIFATRSSSRATCTSIPSATCWASIASTSGRRCSASA